MSIAKEYKHEVIKIRIHSFIRGMIGIYYIRVIPQETVDNNLGPDRLAGPKALEPNYGRQPTL